MPLQQDRSLVYFETLTEENLILAPTKRAALEVLDSQNLEAHLRATENVARIELIDSNDEVVARYDGCALKESDESCTLMIPLGYFFTATSVLGF